MKCTNQRRKEAPRRGGTGVKALSSEQHICFSHPVHGLSFPISIKVAFVVEHQYSNSDESTDARCVREEVAVSIRLRYTVPSSTGRSPHSHI